MFKENELVYIDDSEPNNGGQMAIYHEYSKDLNLCFCSVIDDGLEMSFIVDMKYLSRTGLNTICTQ